MQNCGPGGVFTSSLTAGINYTSSLRAEDVPLSLNGTIVECVDGAELRTIGSAGICIAGRINFRPCHVSNLPSSTSLKIMHTQ